MARAGCVLTALWRSVAPSTSEERPLLGEEGGVKYSQSRLMTFFSANNDKVEPLIKSYGGPVVVISCWGSV